MHTHLILYTDVNQFSIIVELLGTPSDDVIKTIASDNVRSPTLPLPTSFTQGNSSAPFSPLPLLQTLRFVQSLPQREAVPFTKKFPKASAEGLHPSLALFSSALDRTDTHHMLPYHLLFPTPIFPALRPDPLIAYSLPRPLRSPRSPSSDARLPPLLRRPLVSSPCFPTPPSVSFAFAFASSSRRPALQDARLRPQNPNQRRRRSRPPLPRALPRPDGRARGRRAVRLVVQRGRPAERYVEGHDVQRDSGLP
jgi:hypothetical protein